MIYEHPGSVDRGLSLWLNDEIVLENMLKFSDVSRAVKTPVQLKQLFTVLLDKGYLCYPFLQEALIMKKEDLLTAVIWS